MASQGKESSFSGELSGNLSVFLNLSSDSALLSSTPKKTRKQKSNGKASPFKRPKQVTQGPVVATCQKCGKEYRTLRYYNIHMQGHALKEIACRAPPNLDALLQSAHIIGGKVLDTMSSKPSVGCHAEAYSDLVQQLREQKSSDIVWQNLIKFVCEHFEMVISKKVFCMPSSLIQTSLKIVEDIFSNADTREKLFSELSTLCPDKPSAVISTFWSEFVLTFADELLIYLFRSLREATVQNAPKITFDEEERQCIFYIAGSICHSFKGRCYQYSQSKKWRDMFEVVTCKLLEDKLPHDLSEQEKKDRKWTESQNRGGLLFIKGTAQNFFLSIAEVVASYEDFRTGNLPWEDIIQKICCGKAKYEWDSLVGSSIDQDLSFSMMTGIVRGFTNTYGKGVTKRRMDDLNTKNKKVAVAMPLRHRVAPR